MVISFSYWPNCTQLRGDGCSRWLPCVGCGRWGNVLVFWSSSVSACVFWLSFSLSVIILCIYFKMMIFKFRRSISCGDISLLLFSFFPPSPSVFNLIFLIRSMTSRNRPAQKRSACWLHESETEMGGKARGERERERERVRGSRRTWREWSEGQAEQKETDPSQCTQYP